MLPRASIIILFFYLVGNLAYKNKAFIIYDNYPLPWIHFRDMFRYDDVTVPQVLSDVDRMEGKTLPQSSPGMLDRVHLIYDITIIGNVVLY